MVLGRSERSLCRANVLIPPQFGDEHFYGVKPTTISWNFLLHLQNSDGDIRWEIFKTATLMWWNLISRTFFSHNSGQHTDCKVKFKLFAIFIYSRFTFTGDRANGKRVFKVKNILLLQIYNNLLNIEISTYSAVAVTTRSLLSTKRRSNIPHSTRSL